MRSLFVLGAFASAALLSTSAANAQFTTRPQSPASGSWQRTASNPPASVGVPILLTDGTILCHGPQTSKWYKLTPNSSGSYQAGTWSTVASMQSDYGPLYFASSVLADGRLVVIGGEYNLNQGGVWTNKGSVYNPVTNVWTPLAAPSGWSQIGDAQCQVLPDGRFLLAHPFDSLLAVLDPGTMAWTNLAGTGKLDRFDEEGWVLLKDGTIVTCDAINAPHAEKYVPSLDKWVSAGDTPASLCDAGSQELGPMILMPDGRVFAFGATGHNAIYTPGANPTDPGSWVAAPDFPNVGGQLDIADGPAVMMPNGKILAYASPGVFNSPSHFYEWDGTSLLEVANLPNSSGNPSFVGNFLVLPNGQIMFTDFSTDVEIYTPSGNIPNDGWRPTISSSPDGVLTGKTYSISGTQFNGLSNGSAYGDDSTNNTNYPLVRIRNNATGHVKYCRTHNHSTMGVATGATPVSTFFDVPVGTEIGPSVIEVVCNGIPSASRNITVGTVKVMPLSYQIITGSYSSGSLTSLFSQDSDQLVVQSDPSPAKPIEVIISSVSPTLTPSAITVSFAGSVNTTSRFENISMFNFTTNQWEAVDKRMASITDQGITITPPGLLSRFVKPSTGDIQLFIQFQAITLNKGQSWKGNLNQTTWTISQ